MRSALVLWLVCVMAGAAADTVIDDFEGRSTIAPWVFWNGNEFPGATGGLALTTEGRIGSAARLSFDFSHGGHYVEMLSGISLPPNVHGIAFWVHAAPEVHIGCRVVDSTGQVLQYGIKRPFEIINDDSQWFRAVVDLQSPGLYWGGASDGVIHEPLTAFMIEAEPLGVDADRPVVTGHIDIDDIVAIDPATTACDLDPAGAVVALPSLGGYRDGLGVCIHFTHDDPALDAIRDAGFTWIRQDLAWAAVEQVAGTYDFTAYDQLVAALEARGLHALFILDYGNTVYPNASPPTTAAARAAFAAFATASARRYAGRGCRYEIWNEENLDVSWTPAADPVSYSLLCKAAIAAVHAGDPHALVSTGGTAGSDWRYIRDVIAAGGATGAAAISSHPYRYFGGPETVLDEAVAIRSMVRRALPHRTPALWDSEWGYSSAWYGQDGAAADTQARFVGRQMLTTWLMGFPMRIYYDIRDDGTDPANFEHHFGLLATDNTPKPAMLAVQTLNAQLTGRRLAGVYPMTLPDVQAIKLLGPSDVLVVAWRQEAAAAATVRFPQTPEQVLDERGQSLAWTALGGAAVSMPVDQHLVYAVFHRPLRPAAPAITNRSSATPTLSGTTEADAVVSIYDHGVLKATVTASHTGDWSWTPSTALSTSGHVFTVVSTPVGGNASDESAPTTINASTSSDGGGCGGGALGLLGAVLLGIGALFGRRPARG